MVCLDGGGKRSIGGRLVRSRGWEIKFAPIDGFSVHIDRMVCMLNEDCAAGFEVCDPDMSMFTRAGGGVHCMCQPLRREAA